MFYERMLRNVKQGLTASRKHLPFYLLYDSRGSRLYEEITRLDEYYPTRTERAIFERHGPAIASAMGIDGRNVSIIEFGAGTAEKSALLLLPFSKRCSSLRYFPADVSEHALREGQARLEQGLAEIHVEPWISTHEGAFERARDLHGDKAGFFLGSSIGNFSFFDAREFLRQAERALHGGPFLLGVDLRKKERMLTSAYDDHAGVTAEFNLNVLCHLNHALGATFRTSMFRHVAVWNEVESCMELYLECIRTHKVSIDALATNFIFERGERIHTESSMKYDGARVRRLAHSAGYEIRESFLDERKWCAAIVLAPKKTQLR